MTTFNLDPISKMELYNVSASRVSYRGKPALRLIEQEDGKESHSIAIIPDLMFKNGVIETEIAGSLRADAPESMRGFVGIAFHVQPQGSQFECFYLRPTNGRAEDQLRRNHATQYISHPDHPWFKMREENPGVYESYTDLLPDEWTKIKIIVAGVHAQLFVNGAEQPCLVVNDLKLGEVQGRIALWIGLGTEAHFSDVHVNPVE